jgi:hypothetical protein
VLPWLLEDGETLHACEHCVGRQVVQSRLEFLGTTAESLALTVRWLMLLVLVVLRNIINATLSRQRLGFRERHTMRAPNPRWRLLKLCCLTQACALCLPRLVGDEAWESGSAWQVRHLQHTKPYSGQLAVMYGVDADLNSIPTSNPPQLA